MGIGGQSTTANSRKIAAHRPEREHLRRVGVPCRQLAPCLRAPPPSPTARTQGVGAGLHSSAQRARLRLDNGHGAPRAATAAVGDLLHALGLVPLEHLGGHPVVPLVADGREYRALTTLDHHWRRRRLRAACPPPPPPPSVRRRRQSSPLRAPGHREHIPLLVATHVALVDALRELAHCLALPRVRPALLPRECTPVREPPPAVFTRTTHWLPRVPTTHAYARGRERKRERERESPALLGWRPDSTACRVPGASGFL
jgi:hypothetical protein